MNCPNRIKPKLLRDIKTEALLVFIRTTLEQYFQAIDNGKYYFELSTKEDNEFVNNTLKDLLDNLQDTVINSSYLRSLIENASKNSTLKILAKREEPLMVYYDSMVKTMEVSLKNGSFWIPELVVISLLSEWILQEERSTYFYPYLGNIDYRVLIYRYDNLKINLETDKKDIIMNMYRLSSKLIEKLKDTKYKINTSRKSKRKIKK